MISTRSSNMNSRTGAWINIVTMDQDVDQQFLEDNGRDQWASRLVHTPSPLDLGEIPQDEAECGSEDFSQRPGKVFAVEVLLRRDLRPWIANGLDDEHRFGDLLLAAEQQQTSQIQLAGLGGIHVLQQRPGCGRK